MTATEKGKKLMKGLRFLGASMTAAAFAVTGAIGVGSAAYAAPSNAKTSVSGTFDCGGGVQGEFVVNSGNAQAATTWNVAHLFFSGGGTGIFQPSAFDLTFSTPQGTFSEVASKNGPKPTTTCFISAAPAPGYSLAGLVTGKITLT